MNCIEHFCYYNDITDYPEDYHTSCEVVYLYNGDITIVCNNKEFHMTSKMVYVMPSCVKHRIIINDRERYERLLMFINPWTNARTFYSEIIQNMLMGFIVKEPILLKDTFGAGEILERIGKEITKQDALCDEVTAGIVTEFLAAMIRNSNFFKPNTESQNHVIIQIKDYIREHISEDIKISELADKFYVNKFYLSHLFKEQIGMSPKQYLSFVRLSKAYGLLYRSDMSISEISDACGFSNASDMTRQFKEHHGITPTGFRKNISGNVLERGKI